MSKEIAFFDFDGTITTRDTLLEFIKFSRGKRRFYIGFLLNSPYLVAYKLKLISNQRAKEKVLTHFFGNMPLHEFQELCQSFAKEVIPRLVRPGSLERIRELQNKGTSVIIVSASPENWISDWAKSINAGLIATRLLVNGERLTGTIQGKNCYGEEKVNRIKAEYDLTGYEVIHAFGDSSGDKQMLAVATHRHYKPFR